MERRRRESGHLMLITPERVFYAGLLGRPRGRTSGAFHVYVAIEGCLRLIRDDRRELGLALTAVPPNVRHTIESDFRLVICLVIEPETVGDGVLDTLAQRLSGVGGLAAARRIRAAYERLRSLGHCDDVASAELDTMCFGKALVPRLVDPRIMRIVARLNGLSADPVTAMDCAAMAGLSLSRFLHLFKEQTGISFRAFRAWKRARQLLHYVNEDVNLAHLAQNIGYPDSTHFSHSIRRFYGLRPRAIFSGSRDLAIYRSATPAFAIGA